MSETINAMPITAMVLAAGLGTRMRPLTDETPKPLIKAGGKALIDYTLDQFSAAGITRTIVNVHYLAEQVEAHLAIREKPQIIISDERGERLETGGGLKKARAHFGDDPIFCSNTDAILHEDAPGDAARALAKAWDAKSMDALLLLVPIDQTSGYDGAGDFTCEADGQIALRDSDHAPYVFTGLQIIAPSLIDEGPDGAFSTKHLWDIARDRGRLKGIIFDGFWMHVGNPEGLAAAEDFLNTQAQCP